MARELVVPWSSARMYCSDMSSSCGDAAHNDIILPTSALCGALYCEKFHRFPLRRSTSMHGVPYTLASCHTHSNSGEHVQCAARPRNLTLVRTTMQGSAA